MTALRPSYALAGDVGTALGVVEPVGLAEERKEQPSVRGPCLVPAAGGTPHVVAGGDLALVVGEAAFQNPGLLDLDVLVSGSFAPGAIRTRVVRRPVSVSLSNVLISMPGKRVDSHGIASTSSMREASAESPDASKFGVTAVMGASSIVRAGA